MWSKSNISAGDTQHFGKPSSTIDEPNIYNILWPHSPTRNTPDGSVCERNESIKLGARSVL